MKMVSQVTHPIRRWASQPGGTTLQHWYLFKEPVGHAVKDLDVCLDVAQRDAGTTIKLKVYHGPAFGLYLPEPHTIITPPAGVGLSGGHTSAASDGPLYAWIAVVVEVSGGSTVGFMGSVAVDGKYC